MEGPGFGDGNFMMQMGMQYGSKVITESEKGISRYFSVVNVRRYFRVSNSYVKSKLGMLLFPFNKNFSRNTLQFSDDAHSPASSVEYLAPTDDACAFDLYIPIMALITYVTVCGFVKGLKNEPLTPQYLGSMLSSVFFWLAIEVVAIKIGRYILQLPLTFSALDICALAGYKYVLICPIIVFGELLSWVSEILVFLLFGYMTACTAFFVYKASSELFAREGRTPKRALPLVYGAAAAQVLFVTWFSWKPF